MDKTRETDIRHLNIVKATGNKESRRRAAVSLDKIKRQDTPLIRSAREQLVKATKEGNQEKVQGIADDLSKYQERV